MKITDVKIIKSSRKTLSIEIRRDGEIIVRAPYSVKNAYIEALLLSKREWIEKKLLALKLANDREEIADQLTESEIKELAALAKETIPKKVAHYADVLGVKYGKITIRNQKTRWGSCSAKNNLNFNCLLMLCPDHVTDYVVVHELCHITHHDHSKAFWREVERVMPDYKEAKLFLRENGIDVMKRNPAYYK